MGDAVAVTAPQDAQLINVPRDMWEEVRNFDSRLAVFTEGAERRKQLVFCHVAPRLERAERFRNRLTGEANEVRLRIEQIDVAWTSRHEQENDVANSRREVRWLWSERI